MAKISIEVSSDASDIIEVSAAYRDSLEIYKSNRIDGNIDYTTIVITVAPAAITAITAIVTAAINSKKHRRIKIDGIEITNYDVDEVMEIIKNSNDDT